jgi:release factor glutamine methyltransferase
MREGAVTDAGHRAGATDRWTIARLLAWARDDLGARGFEAARLDAELMLAHVLGCDRVRLILDAARELERATLDAYKALHVRRRRGEPVAYLRGEREFYGRRFVVDRRVLVPRPETELLVEVALARTRALSLCARVLDVCTGSGCVAVTLKKERPTTLVMASDVSEEALAVARDNCTRLGALVGLVRSDLFRGLSGARFDLVTANPPYLSDADMRALPPDVRDFEPAVALAAGPDGLALVRRIVCEAPALLAPGGVLALEIGAGQAPAVRALFEGAGFVEVAVERDYGGHERVVSARLGAC